jgi:mRNA interferase MazF
MRRGDIWTVSGGSNYAGKPRPVVIVQDDSFDATGSVTICAFTTDETDAPLFRLQVQPSERNGLRSPCRLMVDKITTVPKSKIGSQIGRLDDEDLLRLNQAVIVFLGLAVSPRASRKEGVRTREVWKPRGFALSRVIDLPANTRAGKHSELVSDFPIRLSKPCQRLSPANSAKALAL